MPRAKREDEDVLAGKRHRLLCVQCLAPVTASEFRIETQGQHRHVFLNPGGVVYEIGCFSQAPGCRPISLPTPDNTWFPPYAWQIGICGRCFFHLGWKYLGPGESSFWGLILKNLRGETTADS